VLDLLDGQRPKERQQDLRAFEWHYLARLCREDQFALRGHRGLVYDARFTPDGGLVLLADQDRGRWDQAAIADATRLLVRAAKRRQPGPYQLQAAILACHAEAATWQETDWEQIVVLYDMLLCLAPSPVTRLHRAIALRYAVSPQAALEEVDDLAETLDRYYLFHATRAELLRAVGRADHARVADQRSLELTSNPAERAVLGRRLQQPA